MGTAPQAPSFGAMFLKYGGGVALMLGCFALVSMLTGMKFQFAAAGSNGGIPLTASAPGVAALVVTGVGGWALGSRWDTPGFAGFRKRRPWVVPVVLSVVVVPVLLVVIFLLVQ